MTSHLSPDTPAQPELPQDDTETLILNMINRHAPAFKWNGAPLNPFALRSVMRDVLEARDAAVALALRSARTQLQAERMVRDLQATNSRLHLDNTDLRDKLSKLESK